MHDTKIEPGAPLAAYYSHPAVRARIREYCGLNASSDQEGCMCVSAALAGLPTPSGWVPEPKFPTTAVDDLLNQRADLFRSVWDRGNLLICLDIDYLNADYPGHAFARPTEVFEKMEAAYQAARKLLRRYGMDPLALMTGRGYQLVGRIPLGSPVVRRLAALAPGVPDWHATQGRRLPPWIANRIPPAFASAYAGTGLVLEYVAHQLVRHASDRSPLPIVLNGTNVGSGRDGREAVSIDLSFAGDPMDVRHVRVAFGGYQKHRLRPDIYGAEVSALAPLVTVPRGRAPLADALASRSPAAAADLAESSDARIPEVTDGVARLVTEYARSSLARFHADFYAAEADDPAAWARTYDRLDLSTLPPCVAAPLAAPNDRLLRPEDLQHVTRYLTSEGWAPRHIAGLVWSRYARDFGWGERWTHLSPRTRAEFDVRVFAGMVATGLDRGVDFNCRSAQEKRLCPASGCPRDLRFHRDRLLRQAAA